MPQDNWPFGNLRKLGYGIVMADPPWKFRVWNETNQQKSPSRHYRLMTMDDLFDLPVHMLGADDSALVMWATQAQLPDAIRLMEAWGYIYKTAGAWAKQSKSGGWAFGTGFILRSAAEFFIIGTMGSPKVAVRNIRNLIVSPRREHSRKPDEMYDMLDAMFPGVPKCELFARRNDRPGWDAWGDPDELSMYNGTP